jgi:hypothetical protein
MAKYGIRTFGPLLFRKCDDRSLPPVASVIAATGCLLPRQSGASGRSLQQEMPVSRREDVSWQTAAAAAVVAALVLAMLLLLASH